MAIQAGDKLYLICHPYYHYLGEVTEVLGVRRVALKNVVQIHSDTRGWTRFFAEGVGKETSGDIIGTSKDVGYIAAHDWPHDIPKKKWK